MKTVFIQYHAILCERIIKRDHAIDDILAHTLRIAPVGVAITTTSAVVYFKDIAAVVRIKTLSIDFDNFLALVQVKLVSRCRLSAC